jgi:hypothetical protein
MRRIVFRSLQVVLISAVIIGCSRELIVEKRAQRGDRENQTGCGRHR